MGSGSKNLTMVGRDQKLLEWGARDMFTCLKKRPESEGCRQQTVRMRKKERKKERKSWNEEQQATILL
jgi:hypothetical protein